MLEKTVEKSALAQELDQCSETKDFAKAFKLVRENREALGRELRAGGIRDSLKKATGDRAVQSFLDALEFGARPLDEVLMRLEKLISFVPGAKVLCKAWGFGVVARVDSFYRRITVDFKMKRGHQFSYAAAADMLDLAPENHVLTIASADPVRIEAMIREKPGDFVKLVLASYGDITVTRLEDIVVGNGFVKAVNWKKFWEGARADLRADRSVAVPARRADPLHLKTLSGDQKEAATWLEDFAGETDPKLILASVREFISQKKLAKPGDDATAEAAGEYARLRVAVAERLSFALTASRRVDDALYARLAVTVSELALGEPPASEMRNYLWERRRYVKAAAALPSREVGSLIRFLAAGDDDAQRESARAKIFQSIPEFCFAAVDETVKAFRDETKTVVGEDGAEKVVYPLREAVGAYMREANAPATLTTLIVGHIEQFGSFDYAEVDVGGKAVKTLRGYSLWPELPGLSTLLAHAIALGEGRQGGETLKMQNLIRRLFGDKAWLEKMFRMLSEPEQSLFFERFQASIAWDPSTHHTIVVRMTRIVPALEAHLVRAEKKREYARETSYRSFAMKKAEYLKLINVDMPENIRKIEFAKGFGDLSENAEYQYAKDEQRALMQKQTLMQADLEAVKPSDFAKATTDEVMPGVAVVVETESGEKTYSILGEWDNEVDLGILSSKSRLGANMLGKKVGDQFEVPGLDGAVSFGRIKAINELSEAIREWMRLPEGMQV